MPGMITRRGIPVSPGVAIGPVYILDSTNFRIPYRTVRSAEIEAEVGRLRQALLSASAASRAEQESVGAKLGKHYGAIFEAHTLLLEDPALLEEIEGLIRNDSYTAAYAVSRVIRRFVKILEEYSDNAVANRSADLLDIERRVLSQLLGAHSQQLRNLTEPVIVLAHDLTPSQTAQLDPTKVHAFVTEAGGRTSHTAIIAAALEIPAVVGVGSFLTDVAGGDDAVVDGKHGVFIIDPDDETRHRFESARSTYATFERSLDELRELPAVTADGVRVALLGNIEFPHEAAHAVAKGAEGIGLYRTEFLYLSVNADPTEDEQFEAYRRVLTDLPPGTPLVIRTLDLGADKFNPLSGSLAQEHNPVLGLRSVRLCLQNLPLFKTQLRAILRASILGDVRILFPMISTLRELRQCKLILREVTEDLEEERVTFRRHVSVGTMIEIPAAALMADRLIGDVDFLSIGTNDLVQYTLAADRTNEHVAELYSASDPAVLQLIQRVLDSAHDAGKPVNVCGEMSGEPIYAALLLGMGLRQFSVTPHNIPEVKRVIRATTLADAEMVARKALQLETATEVTNYLRDQTRRLLPDYEI
jgi:phosphotransferase system enzyme I (PtsI)